VTAFENLAFRAQTLARWRALDGHATAFDRARRQPYLVDAAHAREAAERWLAAAAEVVVVGRAP
jgi:hypothetical protein